VIGSRYVVRGGQGKKGSPLHTLTREFSVLQLLTYSVIDCLVLWFDELDNYLVRLP
jgi:hypothetical protein